MNKMYKVITYLTIMLMCVPAMGSDILIITDGGYFLLKNGTSGIPYVEKIDEVITMGKPNPEPPKPNPPKPEPPKPQPPQDEMAKLTALVSKKADEIKDPTTRRALATVYKMAADRIESGASFEKAFDGIASATDAVLDLTQGQKKWQPWRDMVTDELIKLKQLGKLSTKDEHIKVIRAVYKGLVDDKSAEAAKVDWKLLSDLAEPTTKIMMELK